MPSRTTRRVWTVVYVDPAGLAGLGTAHFDNAAEAQAFATAHRTVRILDELVPLRIADRWTFTRWVRS